MLKYLKNSDIALRVSLNPLKWKWIPTVAYDGPTDIYPKRRTFALVLLFLHVYVDIDNGEQDEETFQKIYEQLVGGLNMEIVDHDENLGSKIVRPNKAGLNLE